jgi:periplasmic protein TonB
MERQFALPVSFAVAVHAALLFGFAKPPRVSAPPEKVCIREFVLPPVEEVAVEVAATDTESRESKPLIEAPVPRSAEPLVVDVAAPFTIPVPITKPVFDRDVKQILPTDFGEPGTRPGKWTGTGGIIPAIGLDKPPHTRFQSTPIYPFEAKRDGIPGEVIVEFIVDEKGRVHSARVVSASNRIFEDATLRAVSKWVFEPGRRNGQIVSFKMSVPVQFNLHE